MSNDNFQHELDDELLSAYLDGELSAEERTAVEARLASDSDAQKLLHQLRSVSQAVQMLPLEPVGHDLRDEILRRVEALKPSDKVQRAPAGDGLPKVTIFQTRRSWIWASLAMAAGLLIMVLQSGDDKNKNLAVVAQKDRGAEVRRELNESVSSDLKKSESATAMDPAKIARLESAPPTMAPSDAPAETPPAPMADKELATEKSPVQTFDKLAANGQAAATSNASTITRGGTEINGKSMRDAPAPEATPAGSIAAAGAPSAEPPAAPANVALGVENGARFSGGRRACRRQPLLRRRWQRDRAALAMRHIKPTPPKSKIRQRRMSRW